MNDLVIALLFRNIMVRSIVVILILACAACNAPDSDTSLFKPYGKRATGIDFRNMIRETEDFNIFQYQYFYNGGGVCIADLDNDGLSDVVFTGNLVKNRIYKNLGNLKFEDLTTQAGIAAAEGWATGVTAVDINNDQLLDLYICRAGFPFPELRKNLLYINKGNFKFEEAAEEYGLADAAYSTKAAFFDYDQDGDLDMFLVNHSTPDYSKGNLEILKLRNKTNPEFTNKLYEQIDGTFTDVTEAAGLHSNVLSFSLDVGIGDVNGDNLPDLYVTNDFNEPDYLYLNQGDKTFIEVSADALDNMSLFSMGCDIADINNDQHPDIMTLDMAPESNLLQKTHSGADNYKKFDHLHKNGFQYQLSKNTLHINQGDGQFIEVGEMTGVARTDWSWSTLMFDFDNDGNRDIFVSNGYLRDHTDMDFLQYTANEVVRMNKGGEAVSLVEYMSKMPPINIPNYFFQNNGSGSFKNIGTWSWNKPSVSQGAAYGDLDNDGDLDLVINNSNDYASVLINQSELTDYHFISLSLRGYPLNTYGIGTTIECHMGSEVVSGALYNGRGFQSSVDLRLHLGLGKNDAIDSIVVTWPRGETQSMYDIQTDQFLTINYQSSSTATPLSEMVPCLISEVDVIEYQHQESEAIDFDVQKLMPFFMSRLGPALASADIDNNGLEDIFIGGAADQSSMIALQQTDGSFRQIELEDQDAECNDAILVDFNGDGHLDIYTAYGSYDLSDQDPLLEDVIWLGDGKGNFKRDQSSNLPLINTSCVTSDDIDDDGDIDLFIGGYVTRGRFPVPSSSYILYNDGRGHFSRDDAVELTDLGMVTDAVITSEDVKELIAVGEWMPIKRYLIEGGGLELVEDSTSTYPTGYFKTIKEVDFDADGDLDYIVGNLGINSGLKVYPGSSLQLHYADVDQNGGIDPLLSNNYIDGRYLIHAKEDFAAQLPSLNRAFNSFQDYATVTAETVEDRTSSVMHKLEINELHSIVLKREGTRLISEPLPRSWQSSPLYAMDAVYDGAANLLFTGGNEVTTKARIGRLRGNHGDVYQINANGATERPDLAQCMTIREAVRDIEIIPYQGGYLVIYGINNGGLRSFFYSK